MFFGFGPVSRRVFGKSCASTETENHRSRMTAADHLPRILFAIVLPQELLNDLFGVFISTRSGVAELNDAILVDDKMARPGIAEIVTPDLEAVIHDYGELDLLFR